MLWRRITDWPTRDWTSPFDELDRMRRDMDRLTEAFSTGFFREPRAGVFPLMNVTEDKDSYYVRAELPGIKADELDISVTGDTLSISGERKIRMISLPSQVDTGKVEARCTDGILAVVLPKAEAAKPKQISVKTS